MRLPLCCALVAYHNTALVELLLEKFKTVRNADVLYLRAAAAVAEASDERVVKPTLVAYFPIALVGLVPESVMNNGRPRGYDSNGLHLADPVASVVRSSGWRLPCQHGARPSLGASVYFIVYHMLKSLVITASYEKF